MFSFSLKIGEIVDDEKLFSNEELERYFHQVIYPLGIRKFQVKLGREISEDGEPVITTLIMKAIFSEASTRGLVCTN